MWRVAGDEATGLAAALGHGIHYIADGHHRVAARLQELLDPAASMRTKACAGGTAPSAVRATLQAAVASVRSS